MIFTLSKGGISAGEEGGWGCSREGVGARKREAGQVSTQSPLFSLFDINIVSIQGSGGAAGETERAADRSKWAGRDLAKQWAGGCHWVPISGEDAEEKDADAGKDGEENVENNEQDSRGSNTGRRQWHERMWLHSNVRQWPQWWHQGWHWYEWLMSRTDRSSIQVWSSFVQKPDIIMSGGIFRLLDNLAIGNRVFHSGWSLITPSHRLKDVRSQSQASVSTNSFTVGEKRNFEQEN